METKICPWVQSVYFSNLQPTKAATSYRRHVISQILVRLIVPDNAVSCLSLKTVMEKFETTFWTVFWFSSSDSFLNVHVKFGHSRSDPSIVITTIHFVMDYMRRQRQLTYAMTTGVSPKNEELEMKCRIYVRKHVCISPRPSLSNALAMQKHWHSSSPLYVNLRFSSVITKVCVIFHHFFYTKKL